MSQGDPRRKSVAVVGGGASGWAAALELEHVADVTLFEKDERLGGHAHTVMVPGRRGEQVALDIGFMVFNEKNYPTFMSLMARCPRIETGPSEMSFSFSCVDTKESYVLNLGERAVLSPLPSLPRSSPLETPSALAQIFGEVLRFMRQGSKDLKEGLNPDLSLSEYLDAKGSSRSLRDLYVYPMGAALWSAPSAEVSRFPAASFLHFFENHGLLSVQEGLSWRHIRGGSRSYVEALRQSFTGQIRTGTEIRSARRSGPRISLFDANQKEHAFDHVVFATHAPETLSILSGEEWNEARVLNAFRYQRSIAYVHSDVSQMPANPAHWGAWNVRRGTMGEQDERGVCITYHLNRLQGIDEKDGLYFVTLNPLSPPAAERTHHVQAFEHPLFDASALRAQAEVLNAPLAPVQGATVSFCGAYLGYGFHEDAMRSGVQAARRLKASLE